MPYEAILSNTIRVRIYESASLVHAADGDEHVAIGRYALRSYEVSAGTWLTVYGTVWPRGSGFRMESERG